MIRLKKFFTIFLTLLIILTSFTPVAFADEKNTNIVTDNATYGEDIYESVLGEDTTMYAGRIWTDKSVLSTDINFTSGHTDKEVTIQKGDSDFLITYSALATSIHTQQSVPADVVFILDFSASMNWGVNETEVTETTDEAAKEASRLNSMVKSLNSAIDTLVNANQNNRIGVVIFNGESKEMMSLQEVTPRENKDYFEISSFTLKEKSDPDAKQEANASVTCNINNKTMQTAGGTNIQAGLNTGMNMLINEDTTTFKLQDGTDVTRTPNVVLMSDGAPTTFSSSSNAKYKDHDGTEQTSTITKDTDLIQDEDERNVESGSWWEEISTKAIGPGNNDEPDSADGFMALLTAAYKKEKITQNYYGQNDEEKSTNVYTIGFSTDNQTSEMVEMANLVLNPGENMEKAESSSTSQIKDVATAWQNYKQGTNPVVHAPLGSGNNDRKYNYTVNIAPENTPSDINYVDEYFLASDEDLLDDAFNKIVTSILSLAKLPTQVTGSATEDGYITYTDPIGEYMELDDMKAIIWNGEVFKDYTQGTDQEGNKTFTFHGKIENPAYTQENDISSILITLKEDNNKIQVLEIKIPAAAIPLRVSTINLSGTYSNTSNKALPSRIIYGVSLKDSILTKDGKVDTSKLDSDYVKNNTDQNGNIKFYSNKFSNNKIDNYVVGDAMVSFSPSNDNPFYYRQDNVYIYEDKDLTTPPTSTTLDPNKDYYLEYSYYGHDKIETTVLTRKGSEFPTNSIKQDEHGIYAEKGSARLGNLNKFINTKKANNTNTATTYYHPSYDQDGDTINIRLGNNGYITKEVAKGNLSIHKEVTSDEGVTSPNESFKFNVSLKNADDTALSGSYPYSIVDASGKTITSSTISNGSSLTLKAGESANITGLPLATKYSITEDEENMPSGFSLQNSTNTTGTITADNTQTATFTNSYKNINASLTLNATKNLTGRDLKDGEFKFYVSNNENQLVLSEGTNDINGNIEFDDIIFSEEGDYTLNVWEETGKDKNIEYDLTKYQIEVSVTKNEEGVLQANATLPENGLVFNNTYKETVIIDDPTNEKNNIDKTDNESKPQTKPEIETPQTGDNNNMTLWSTIFIISLIGMYSIFAFKYRHKFNK